MFSKSLGKPTKIIAFDAIIPIIKIIANTYFNNVTYNDNDKIIIYYKIIHPMTK